MASPTLPPDIATVVSRAIAEDLGDDLLLLCFPAKPARKVLFQFEEDGLEYLNQNVRERMLLEILAV